MRGRLEGVALALILALCLLADGIMDTFGPAVFAAVTFVVLIAAETLRRLANMPYYRTCPHCGANLDPGESCDCDKKETALGVSSTQGGMVEQVLTYTVSAPIIQK